MNVPLDDLAPTRRAMGLILGAFLVIMAFFALLLYAVLRQQAQTSDALNDLEANVEEVELQISPLVSAPGGRYDTAQVASAGDGFVLVTGATCFRPGVAVAATRVTIRWSWVDEVPVGALPFYNEDGGVTTYGEGRLSLDAGGCFEFTGFEQRFPDRLQRDLDRGIRGDMEITFALKATDITDPANPVTANEVFIFSGPFTIQD